MSRPIVGIESSLRAEDGERLVELNTRYSDAVYRAGGIPVALAAFDPSSIGGASAADVTIKMACRRAGGPVMLAA